MWAWASIMPGTMTWSANRRSTVWAPHDVHSSSDPAASTRPSRTATASTDGWPGSIVTTVRAGYTVISLTAATVAADAAGW